MWVRREHVNGLSRQSHSRYHLHCRLPQSRRGMRAKISLTLLFAAVMGVFVFRTWRLHYEGQSVRFPDAGVVIDEIRFEDTPLQAALAELSRRSGIKIDADWDALDVDGIAPDTPVRLRLFGLSTQRILHAILEHVGRKDGELTLSWRNASATVTTAVAAAREMEWHMYDASVYLGSSIPPSNETYDSRVMLIEDVLSNAVANDSWSASYPDKSVVPFHGRLFIFQTPENHRSVERVLSRLAQIQERFSKSRPVQNDLELLPEH